MKRNTPPFFDFFESLRGCYDFFRKLENTKKVQTGELKAIDVKVARVLWSKFIQKANFPGALNTTSETVNKKITKINLAFNFMTMVYFVAMEEWFMRKYLMIDAIYLILLPKKSHFTLLLS